MLDFECEFYGPVGEPLRCFPQNLPVTRDFSDTSCTTPLYLRTSGGVPSPPFLVDEPADGNVYQVDVAHSAQPSTIYESTDFATCISKTLPAGASVSPLLVASPLMFQSAMRIIE